MPLLKEEAGSVSASTNVLFLLLKVTFEFILRVRYSSRISALLPVGVCTICILVCVGTCSIPTSHQSETEAYWRNNVA